MNVWLLRFHFLAILSVPLSVFPQGVVNFNNNVLTSPPDRLVRCLDGPFAGGFFGTNFMAQLLYGTDPASLTPHTVVARFRASSTAQPGTWSGSNRTLTGVGGVGTTIFLQVRMWDSNFGATFDQAQAVGGLWGSSTIFTYSQVLSTPPAVSDTYMHNFVGFAILSCVPEPSVALLAIPIFGVLWLLRMAKTRPPIV